MDGSAPTSTESALAPLRARAQDVFVRVSPYEGSGFRNHCERLFRFATALMRAQGLQFEEDVAYMIALWHDLGIVSEKDEGANYLRRSHALFLRESAAVDLPEVDPSVIEQCLVYNHRLLPVPNVHPVAECFRRAVIVEHSRGLKRYGLDRAEIRQVFDAFPRDNFDRVLLDFTWRTLKREPLTIVNGIFF